MNMPEKNNKVKILVSSWNNRFHLLGGWYCILDIRDCSECITIRV